MVMQREDAWRLAVGVLVFLLPVIGVFTTIFLALICILHRPMRLLCASLISLLLLREVLVYTHLDLPMYVVAISFVPPTIAYIISRRFQPLAGSFMYIMATLAIGYPAAFLVAPDLLNEKIFFLAILGGLSGAFLQHVSSEMDFTVPFGVCMVMWLFSFDYPLPELGNIFVIYIFAVLLGVGAYWAKAADVDAVLSEIIICILVVLFAGLNWFLLLLSFYLIGGAFTRYGYSYKHSLGIAEAKGGVRGYKTCTATALCRWWQRSATEYTATISSSTPFSARLPLQWRHACQRDRRDKQIYAEDDNELQAGRAGGRRWCDASRRAGIATRCWSHRAGCDGHWADRGLGILHSNCKRLPGIEF